MNFGYTARGVQPSQAAEQMRQYVVAGGKGNIPVFGQSEVPNLVAQSVETPLGGEATVEEVNPVGDAAKKQFISGLAKGFGAAPGGASAAVGAAKAAGGAGAAGLASV